MGDRGTNTIFLELVSTEEEKNIVMILKNGATDYNDISTKQRILVQWHQG